MGNVTIKDVAREAGVAISTVSNALNNSELVNEETRARIIEIAERMNYVPNLSGKYLKSGRSNMLGFFTSSISGEYFGTLLESMNRQCDELGYALNVVISRNEAFIKTQILGKRFDGIFIFQGERIDQSDLELIEKHQIKTVLLDRDYHSHSIGSVVFDSYLDSYTVTKHLINLGHKKIAFIGGAADVFDSIERKRGFLDAMKEYKLPVPEEYILNGYFEELLTYNIVTVFLKNRTLEMPDAFIAGNDLSAIGCMKALTDQGYRIPEDVNVIGFDDISIAQYFTPRLSTVHNPINTQGIIASKLLVDMVENDREGSSERLSGKFIPRESSALKI